MKTRRLTTHRKTKIIPVIAVLGLLTASANAQETTNNSANAEIEALKQEIQALKKDVEALGHQQELAQTNAILAAKNAPKISIGGDGLKAISADSNFVMNIHGYLQLDSRTFLQDAQTVSDGFILRRVHPIITGKVFQDFDYQFMAEFGGSSPSVYDAYLNYHPVSELQLQAGRFKTPLGMEWLQSAANLSFNERSLANNLVPLRSLGVDLHGDLFGGRASYAAGVFNSVADGANASNSSFENNQEFIGRIFVQPLKKSDIAALQGLGFGVSGSYGDQYTSSALTSGYKTDGQQTFFTYTNGVVGNGAHWRLSPQGYYYYGSFSLSGEYAVSDQQVSKGTAKAELQNTAWEVAAGYVLTGEKASFSGVTPKHPFNLHGDWGAWQIVARYEELDVDDAAFPIYADPNTSATSAEAWAIGLNWWLNKNVRVMTSFSRTTFDGGLKGTVTKDPEEVVFTRLQLSF